MNGNEETEKQVLLAVRENRKRRWEAARILAASEHPCVFEKDPIRLIRKLEEHPGRVLVLDREGYPDSFLEALAGYQAKAPFPAIVYLCRNPEEEKNGGQKEGACVSFVAYGRMKEALAAAVCLAERQKREGRFSMSDYQRSHPFISEVKKEVSGLAREEKRKTGISRRQFLKGSAAAAAVFGIQAAGCSPADSQETAAGTTGGALEEITTAAETKGQETTGEAEEILYNSPCRSNCFQSCLLNAHVRDGKVVRMSPKEYPNGDYTGCCLKGLTLPQRTYSATRIQYPMRRTGERGEDKWERISWEEAVEEIAAKFTEIQQNYGNQALVFDAGSGNYGLVHGVQGLINRMAYMLEATKINASYDQAYGYGTDRVIGGGVWLTGSETADFLNSKTIFIWGSNPVHAQPQNWRILAKAKRQGTKLICIDPICSATAGKCDEYIPITPGSDLLLTMAMMRLIVEKGWTDETFMKTKSTSPFLVRKDTGKYLKKSDFAELAEGEEDDFYVWDESAQAGALATAAANPALEGTYTVEGIECDTAFALLKARIMETDLDYAAEKTGISLDKIEALADEYVHSGATGVYTNYGIDHYQNGHLWGFALGCMAAITGNLARSGCSLGGLFVNSSITFNYSGMYVSNGKVANGVIPQNAMGQVFKEQKLFGEDYPVKALYTACSNSMSNFAEQNQWFEDILPNLEYWVVADTEMTDCARYADMVLPAAFWLEVDDLRSNYNNPYLTYQEKAIEPLYESKPDGEILRLIAEAMGLGEFFPAKTDKEWMQVLMDLELFDKLGITFDRLMEEKVIRSVWNGDPFVRGESAPFPTPQGRARVYCEDPQPRTNWGQDISEVYEKERMPYFKAPNEAWSENELYKKYPLVFIQDHTRFRSHTQWYNVPVLRELDPEPYIRLNPEDAKARNLSEGDTAEVYNDRGHAVAKVVLDPAVQPGVLTMPKGWQREQFIEGCFQELTNTSSDPMACNFAYFDTLVEVRKYKGGN